MTYKDSQYFSDMEDRDELRRELENDALQEALDAKVNDLMQDHRFFAQFIKDSVGEEWLDNFINDICYANQTWMNLPLFPVIMSLRFKEYAEQCIKEKE